MSGSFSSRTVSCSASSAASPDPAALPFVLCDAHAHMGSRGELEERRRFSIPSLICASDPEEAGSLTDFLTEKESPSLLPTFGLHPWRAGSFCLSRMAPFLEGARIIGEIGMDSVWCDVPLKVQEQVFRQQLAMAAEQKKPVILHTKGQEKEIAKIIEKYPNTYLIHWYSSLEDLESYLRLDCYFSVGPDVWWNPAVRRVAALAPPDRLLLETDGMGAVKWAYTEGPPANGLPAKSPASVRQSLLLTLEQIAKIRRLSPKDAGILLEQNFKNGFLKRADV